MTATDLESYIWASAAVYAAELDPDGTVRATNGALALAAGRDLAGGPFEDLLTGPQRRAFAGRLARAGAEWDRTTLAFAVRAGGEAEDRCVWLRRDGDGTVLLVAEPAWGERDRLVEQVLLLNDDLIATQRSLARRHRELEDAHARAEDAARRVLDLEAIVLAGLAPRRLDAALDALLAVARDVLPGDRAALLLVDETREQLVLRASVGGGAPDGGLRVRLGEGIAGRVAATGRAVRIDDVALEPDGAPATGREHGSLIAVPLRVDGEVVAVLSATAPEPGRFDDGDLRLLELVGERAALAIGHAQLRERERNLAETLQRSLLPDRLPQAAGVELAARYVARAASAHVGGDFYDAISLPDGSLGVAIGDVAGKGLRAASAMGHLRSGLRAYALDGCSPAELLARLDRLAAADDVTATALYAVVDPDRRRVRIASAGHLPPLLIGPAGVEYVDLDGALSPPLGVGVDGRPEIERAVTPASRVVLYTDGIVERTHAIEDGMEALRRAAAAGPAGDLGDLCDHLLAALTPTGRYLDDVALLALRIEAAPAR